MSLGRVPSLVSLGSLIAAFAACVPDDPPSSRTCEVDAANPLGCGALTTLDPISCADDPEAPAFAVELGTGEQAFESLGEPAVLEVHQGFQGGYHAVVSLQVDGARAEVSSDLAVAAWIATGPACAPTEATPAHPTTFAELVPPGCDRVLARMSYETYGGGAWAGDSVSFVGQLLMFGEVRPGPGPAVVGVWVQDACGRTTSATRAVDLR